VGLKVLCFSVILLHKAQGLLPARTQTRAVRPNDMETIKLQTESYLFEESGRQFRTIPFYELSIDEWVVYEKGQPKYFIDFNRRQKPLIQDLKSKLDKGETLEDCVWKLGRFLGREWTTKHNITVNEIPNSQQTESIELQILDDLSELFMDLMFVATDNIDKEVFLNDDRLFSIYLVDEMGIESSYIDNHDNLIRLLNFLFNTNVNLTELTSSVNRKVYDLTLYKNNCISTDTLDQEYQIWLNKSGRENNMDEYGNLIGIVSYIKRNEDKEYLVLITEKRKHWV
jgi:hypothetical protein